MEDVRTNKVLHVSLSIDVALSFNEERTKIKSITLSLSKLGELFRNQLLDEESIMQVEKIGLVYGGNAKVLVDVAVDSDLIMLAVNNEETKAQTEGKMVFDPSGFEFFLSEDQHISEPAIKALYRINETYQDVLTRRKMEIKSRRRHLAVKRSLLARKK